MGILSYNNFVSNVCYVLDTNNNTLSQENQTQNNWTDSTESIGNAWLSQNSLTAVPPTCYNDFYNDLNHPVLDEWSMDAVTELLEWISTNYSNPNFTSGLAAADSSMLTQQGSLIQAQSAQDTSIGDSEAKAETSTLQNSISAGQPNSDAGNAVTGILTSGANAQSSIAV